MAKKNKIELSIVSPVYKAESIINELVEQIKSSVIKITSNFEIILVNDNSPDNSWQRIIEECKIDKRIKGIHLSRNFGQHYSITAGLKFAKGNWVVVMDCDLQDRPDEIPNLYNKVIQGWDIVFAKRVNREDKFSKQISSKLFYKLYNYFSGLNFDGRIASFGIYNKKVIKEYNKLKETSRSFPSLVQYLGFNYCTLDVKHSKRFEGKTSYTFSKLINLASDVVLSNSNRPLRLIVAFGFIVSFCSFLVAVYNFLSYSLGFIKVPGFTTTIFSIWFVGGLILLVLGIIGLYVGKIFNEVKGRPLYIISKKINI